MWLHQSTSIPTLATLIMLESLSIMNKDMSRKVGHHGHTTFNFCLVKSVATHVEIIQCKQNHLWVNRVFYTNVYHSLNSFGTIKFSSMPIFPTIV